MAPSFTTAIETLGAPLRAIPALTALSMLARVASGRETWPAREVAQRLRMIAANATGREVFIPDAGPQWTGAQPSDTPAIDACHHLASDDARTNPRAKATHRTAACRNPTPSPHFTRSSAPGSPRLSVSRAPRSALAGRPSPPDRTPSSSPRPAP